MIPTPPGDTNLFKPLSVKLFFLLSSIIFNLTSVAACMSYLISFLMLWGTEKKPRHLTRTLLVELSFGDVDICYHRQVK